MRMNTIIKAGRHCVVSACGALALISIFLLCDSVDQPLHDALLNEYQNTGLLELERPLYLEYLERRYNIDRQGSPGYIKQVRHWIDAENDQALILAIIRDAGFYEYLLTEGRLFLAPSVHQNWYDQRQQRVIPLEDNLLTDKLSLKPDGNSVADLVTYSFVHQQWLGLVLSLLVMMVLGPFTEARVGRLGALQLGLVSAILLGLLYRLASDHSAPLLSGSGNFLVAWFALGLSDCARNIRSRKTLKTRLSGPLLIAAGIILLFGTKLLLESGFLELPLQLVWLQSGALVAMTAVFFWTGLNLGSKSDEHDQQSNGDGKQKDWEYRVALAEALDAVSQMEFGLARGKLLKMLQQYPTDSEVLIHLYYLEKLNPDTDAYWACVVELIQFGVRFSDYPLMRMLFCDIQKNAASKALARERLKPEHYHKMMTVFVEHDDMEKAEQSFLFLELAGQSNIIKDACLLLKQEFRNRRNTDKEHQYQMLMERL